MSVIGETSGSLASKMSPSFRMVSKYFITSIVFFILLNILLVLEYNNIHGHYFQPILLALVHITTLGWITMIIFGAMFQLVPVVLEVKLFSEKLGEIQFWIYLAGVIGLVTAFWSFDTGLHMAVSASLLVVAILIFIFNISASMAKVKKWNITGIYLIAALFYLLSTAAAGILMAINLGYPFIQGDHLQYLKLHVDVAFIGWVLIVIMGVSYKLIPMFSLSHGYSQKSSVFAFILVNTGLLGITTVMHYKIIPYIYYFFTALIGLGILFFLHQIYLILKRRLRKKFDIGMKHSIIAFSVLLLDTILGLFLVMYSFNDLTIELNLILLYGFMSLIGFFSILTVGQLYKILPFLVWYHKFSSKVGKEPVPLLKEMFNEKLAKIEMYFLVAGFTGGAIGIALYIDTLMLISFILMLTGTLIFAYNMYSIYTAKGKLTAAPAQIDVVKNDKEAVR